MSCLTMWHAVGIAPAVDIDQDKRVSYRPSVHGGSMLPEKAPHLWDINTALSHL